MHSRGLQLDGNTLEEPESCGKPLTRNSYLPPRPSEQWDSEPIYESNRCLAGTVVAQNHTAKLVRPNFLHWQYPAAAVQRLVPQPLEVESFYGSAWVGITPFLLRDLRPKWLPTLPWISEFSGNELSNILPGTRWTFGRLSMCSYGPFSACTHSCSVS